MRITAKELAHRLSIEYVHAASFLKTLVVLGKAQKVDTLKTGKRGRSTVVYELDDHEGFVDIILDLHCEKV